MQEDFYLTRLYPLQDEVLACIGSLDSPESLLADKLSAIVSREEHKDLADIWGLCAKLGLASSSFLTLLTHSMSAYSMSVCGLTETP